MADKDNCDCLVCAIRRELSERYPGGLTAPTDVDHVMYCLAGVVASIVEARGPGSMLAFTVHYLAAAEMLERRNSGDAGRTVQ